MEARGSASAWDKAADVDGMRKGGGRGGGVWVDASKSSCSKAHIITSVRGTRARGEPPRRGPSLGPFSGESTMGGK